MGTGSQILQFILAGLTLGSIYALIALCFTIVYNATEVINFAQGEFAMLGGMLMATFQNTYNLPPIPAFFLSVVLATLMGVSLERIVIRPLKNPSVIVLIVVTIGASVFLRGMAMLIWGKDARPVRAFSGENPLVLGKATILPQTLWVLGITFLVVIFLSCFFRYTLAGRAMRACAENKIAAQLVGIRVKNMVSLAFVLSSALGALAGIIIAPITFTSYAVGTMLGLKGFSAMVLGGLGSSFGAVTGGFVLGLVESMGAGYISSRFKDGIAFLILLMVLFIKPSGIMGKRTLFQ